MKRDLPAAASPDLERVFRELVDEESSRVIQERRVAHREPLCRPVRVLLKQESAEVKPVDGFSKNCSPAGIGLVTAEEFSASSMAVIEIHRFHKTPIRILAECRWSDKFGTGWFFSGWKFLSLARN